MEKPVYGFEDVYYINEKGIIYNKKTKQEKKYSKSASNRKKRFRLNNRYYDGIYLTYYSFYPNENKNKFLVPKDGDWFNNSLDNIVEVKEDKSTYLKGIYGSNFHKIPYIKNEYYISDKGEVISFCLNTPKLIKSSINNYGYLFISAVNNFGDKKRYKIHRLVGEFFIPNPRGELTINHIDGDKTNNNVNNLEWCSLQYNIKDELRRLDKPKECAVISNRTNQIIEVFDTITEAANAFEVDSSTASKQCRGQKNCFYSKGIKMRLYNSQTGEIQYTRFD